jgi:hypothetical protein
MYQMTLQHGTTVYTHHADESIRFIIIHTHRQVPVDKESSPVLRNHNISSADISMQNPGLLVGLSVC